MLALFVISVLCLVLVCAVLTRRALLAASPNKSAAAASRGAAAAAMPRKIRMGTAGPAAGRGVPPDPGYRAPDLISDVSHVYRWASRLTASSLLSSL